MKSVCIVGQCVSPVSILKGFIRLLPRQRQSNGIATGRSLLKAETGETRCPTMLLALTLSLLCFGLHAAESPANENVRFIAVDIYLDTKDKPLAAYQLELSAADGNVKIVGIEGGEHPAFREAPFYDSKAIQQERVVIAAFSTEPATKLPKGKTRVATIHVQVSGGKASNFELKLEAAGGADGNRIEATADSKERKTE